ncbi:MAG: hypothetical protein IRZ03_17005 [Acidobacterium ailaaui]|nr:hypothetical protein [Pseudacidobacterium ailaaui]
MPAFSADSLLLPSFVILIIGTWITYRVTHSIEASFVVSFIKTLVFFIYFHFVFDGYFTFLDDWVYLESAKYIKLQGYNLFSFLYQNHFNWVLIAASIAGSEHFLYNLFNLFSFDLFGIHYFSPVALNVILTFFTGYFAYRIVRLLGFQQKLSILFYLFFVLHWDTILWSSILNLKDILVQFFTVGAFYQILLIEKGKKRWIHIIYLAAILILFLAIRFYLPFFLGFSYFLYRFILFLSRIKNPSVSLLIVFSGLFSFILLFVLFIWLYGGDAILHIYLSDIENPFIGILRYLFTPIPFHASEHYEYLNLASPLDYLLIPFFFYGMYHAVRSGQKFFILLVIYFLLLTLFYGTYLELQGVRQKVQITFIFAIFEYIGLLKLLFRLPDIKIFNTFRRPKVIV